jgi:hypothetical protein
MAPSNSKAMLETLLSKKHHPFLRTPKGYSVQSGTFQWYRPYRLPNDGSLWAELVLALYAASGLMIAVVRGQSGPLLLLLTSLLGFTYVAYLEIREVWSR